MSAALKATRPSAKAARFKEPAAVPVFSAGVAPLPASVDAELIQLCATYTAALDAVNNGPGVEDPDVDPAWQAVEALQDRLHHLPATTFEGPLAKAHVAQHEARQRDGSENYSTSHVGAWPEVIVRDLLRLGGGVGQAWRDDSAVLSASTTYQTIKAEEHALEACPEPAFGTPEARQREEAFEALALREDDALDLVIAAPARTSAGLRAKAVMVTEILPNAVTSFELDLESVSIRLALSLAADLSGEAQ